MSEEINAANEKAGEMEQKYFFASARLHAFRQEHGFDAPEEDFSSKENFIELEKERMAFKRFFNKQWKIAKKQIRKQIGDSIKQSLGKTQKIENTTEEDKDEK